MNLLELLNSYTKEAKEDIQKYIFYRSIIYNNNNHLKYDTPKRLYYD